MLSELTPIQIQLLRLIWDGIYLKGMVEPGPEIPMSKGMGIRSTRAVAQMMLGTIFDG